MAKNVCSLKVNLKITKKIMAHMRRKERKERKGLLGKEGKDGEVRTAR